MKPWEQDWEVEKTSDSPKPWEQDWDTGAAEAPAQESSLLDQAAALGTSIGRGASFGFADELSGGVGAALDTAMRTYEEGKLPSSEDVIKSYEENKKYAQDVYKQQEEEFPATSFGGQVIGGIAAPGGLASKGVKGIAAEGALFGLGESKEDSLAGLAKDAATGAAVGGVIGTAGKALSGAKKGLSNWADKQTLNEMNLMKSEHGRLIKDKGADYARDLSKFAREGQPIRALEDLPEQQKIMEKIDGLLSKWRGVPKVEQAAAEATKAIKYPKTADPVIKVFEQIGGESTPHLQLQRAEDLKNKVGEVIGGYTKIFDKEGIKTFNPYELAERIDSSIGNKFRNEPLYQSLSKQYEAGLQTILQRSGKTGAEPITFAEAQQLKKLLTDYAYNQGHAVEGKEMVRQMVGEFNKYYDDVVGKAIEQSKSLAGDTVKDVQKARKTYGMASDLVRILENKVAREESNLAPSILRSGASTGGIGAIAGGVVGGLSGGAAGAILAPVAGAALKKYGSRAVIGADQIVQKVANTKYAQVIGNAAKRGANAVAATHYVLSQQDPEYRKLTEEQDGTATTP